MDGGALHVDGNGSELESDLVDLSGVDLEQLSTLPGTVFARSLRRILAEEGEHSESETASDRYAAFQNEIMYGEEW
jgi:FXSXX-COOH protein